VNVDQLSFSPDFDLSSLRQFGGGVDEPPSRGFAGNLQLNVSLRSSQSVNPVSRTLSVSGAANLRVTGTAAQPVILAASASPAEISSSRETAICCRAASSIS